MKMPGLFSEIVTEMRQKQDLASSLMSTHPDKAHQLMREVDDVQDMLEEWLVWTRLLADTRYAATVETLRRLGMPESNFPTPRF
jgi:hypothetical protein